MTQRAEFSIIYQKLVQGEWTTQPQKKTLSSFPFFALIFLVGFWNIASIRVGMIAKS
jgi:hypothetical protein